jgi:hypothetical protein
LFQDLPGLREAIVQIPHQPGRGPDLPGEDALDQVSSVFHGLPQYGKGNSLDFTAPEISAKFFLEKGKKSN